MKTHCHLWMILAMGASFLMATNAVRAQQTAPAQAATPAAPAGRGAGQNLTAQQTAALNEMNAGLSNLTQAVTMARANLAAAVFATPRNDTAIQTKTQELRTAELTLANARAQAFAGLQATTNQLSAAQVTSVVAAGGNARAGGRGGGGGGGNGRQPDPIDFNYHEGYVSIFDGVSLKGWDGHPKFWRVENGAIVGESSASNPSGNQYITYRDIKAHDLDLKIEIKIEGRAGSGIQYRSLTGIQWRRGIPANVQANAGPLNNDWMSTGPQADFWPTTSNTGQFYSENSPIGIQARRGTVAEGFGETDFRKQVAVIGDSAALQNMIKMEDWNQYHIIARGPVHILILNGQLMSVQVDDDPTSVNNQDGYIGIELESTGKVSVRNIWLKKIN